MKDYFLILCLVSGLYNSQAQDTLVTYNELTFNSEFEKHAFKKHFEEKQNNYLELFLGLDSDVDNSFFLFSQKKFLSELALLNDSKILNKKPEKKVKIIYEKVHNSFFDQYQDENHFSDIFKNGKYNCVSATAMYGLIFNELDVPFTIKEKPTHVYIVAYPKKEQVLVESTDPTGGFIRFTDSNKQTLINQLSKAKLISSSEMRNMSVDELFKKYYLIDEDINLKQLVGIQYLNDAIYRMNKEDVEGAYNQAEKACMFYSSDRTSNLLLATTLEFLVNQNFESIESVKYLAKLSRFEQLDDDFVLSEFSRMINILLIEKGDSERLKEYYNKLINLVNNKKIELEMNYIYHYEQGRARYNQAKYKASLPFFEKAYSTKPTNLDIGNIFINAMIKTMSSIPNIEAIQKLEEYHAAHPSLIENNFFKSMLANTYLIEFGQAFDLKKEKDGLNYKALFEKYYSPELSIDQSNLGRAYSITAVYYFRKGYTTKARQILNEGLNKAPHNHELQVRKRMIR